MKINDSEDRDLEMRFSRLREELFSSIPPLAIPTPAQVKKGPSRWMPAAAGLATVAAAVGALIFGPWNAPGPDEIALASVLWPAPTDFLLDIPRSSLLGTVPRIGGGLRMITGDEPAPLADDTLR